MAQETGDGGFGSAYYKRASELHNWAKLISAEMTDDAEKADARRVLRIHIVSFLFCTR